MINRFAVGRLGRRGLAGDTQAGHRQDDQLAKFHHPENVRPALVCSTVLLW